MDTLEALERRIAAATSQDVVLGLFLESSLAHVQARYGEPEADALRRDLFGGRSLVSFLRYPVGDLLRVLGSSMEPAARGVSRP